MKNEKNITTNTNTENTNFATSNGRFVCGLYILSIILLVVSLLGVIVEFVEDIIISEETVRGLLITTLNFCVQKYYFDKHMRAFKDKKEKEGKKEVVVTKKIIVHDPKEEKYFFPIILLFSLLLIGGGIYLYKANKFFWSSSDEFLMWWLLIFGAIFFLMAIWAGVEYIAEIKPDFRKKLPQWWQKRIEDIMKPKEVISEETSVEEDILKFREWIRKKLS